MDMVCSSVRSRTGPADVQAAAIPTQEDDVNAGTQEDDVDPSPIWHRVSRKLQMVFAWFTEPHGEQAPVASSEAVEGSALPGLSAEEGQTGQGEENNAGASSTAGGKRPRLHRAQSTLVSSSGVGAARMLIRRTVTTNVGSDGHWLASKPILRRAASAGPPVFGRTARVHDTLDEDHSRSDSLPPSTREASPARIFRVFPTMETPAERPSAHSETGRQEIAKLSRSRSGPVQMRCVVAGLMGSGKSTLCRMLANLLGGTWINQDEFASQKRNAKKAFLAEIKRVAADRKVPVVIVDKINTMRQHRADILESFNSSSVRGVTILVQLVHPLDAPGRLDHAMELCESRIHGRGEGHRTLMGSDPKLRQILQMTAKGAEAMEDYELAAFRMVLSVDMTLSPTTSIRQALSDLYDEDLLMGFDVDDLLSESRLMEAWEATNNAESSLRGNRQPGPQQQQSNQTSKKTPAVMFWEIAFERDAFEEVRNAWAKCASAIGGANLKFNEDAHVTLLYLGGQKSAELAKKYPHLDENRLSDLQKQLSTREGTLYEIALRRIVCDGRVACAEVTGVDEISANRVSHITMALAEGVPPKKSNELLARINALEDFQTGFIPWMHELGLGQHSRVLKDFCASRNISSPSALASNAAEAAAVAEPRSVEKSAVVQRLLIEAGGSIASEEFPNYCLCLNGRVNARRRH